MRVIVVGRLNYRSWETQDGQNRSVVDLAIDEIAPSLRWARANVERTSGGGSVAEAPKARDDFEEALAATVRWYQESEWWWRPIKNGDFKKYYQQQYGERLQAQA